LIQAAPAATAAAAAARCGLHACKPCDLIDRRQESLIMKTRCAAAVMLVLPSLAHATDVFPRKGIFTEADSESELDFAKRELGFPDETCTFSSPRNIGTAKWRISMRCDRSEDRARNQKETATLERKGKGWLLTRKDAHQTFKMEFKP
jgi:hypothetical protein